MPVGVELRKTNTTTVIVGNEMPLLALKSKQTITIAAAGGFSTLSVSNPVASVVAFKSNKPVAVTESGMVSGSKNYTFRTVEANTTVDVYFFDLTSNAVVTPSRFGLQTFSPSGELLFDAVYGKYFRPVSKHNMSFAAGYNKTLTAVPAGRSYAVSVADAIRAWDYGEGGGTDYFPAFHVGSSVVGSTYSRFVAPGDYFGETSGDVLIIDVTNF